MAVMIEGGQMPEQIRPKQLEKNGYSPFCSEIVNVC